MSQYWNLRTNLDDNSAGVGNVDTEDFGQISILLSKYVLKEEGKGLSSNDFTNEDKLKLDSIQSDAQPNVLETISVNNGEPIHADENKNINLTIPTRISQLQNDSDFALNISSSEYSDYRDSYVGKSEYAVKNVCGTSLSCLDTVMSDLSTEINRRCDKDNILEGEINNVSERVSSVEGMLPIEASCDNKLADKCYVDGCIASVISGAVCGLDVPLVGGNSQYINSICEKDGKICATASSVCDTYDGTCSNPISGKGVLNALQSLNVSCIGGEGNYISAICQNNGKISAVATLMDSAPTSESTNAVTSCGILNAISETECRAKCLDNATGVLSLSKGGTGYTTAQDVVNNVIQSGMSDLTEDVSNNTDIITSCTNGYSTQCKGLFRRKASHLWNYIQSKISSVLGLTSSCYSGNASTATCALYNGCGTDLNCLTSAMSDLSDEITCRCNADTTLQGNINTVCGKVTVMEGLIPTEASSSNQLADKSFVNSTIQTNTANFRGNYKCWSNVPTNANDYPTDFAGNKTPTSNDYMVVNNAIGYTCHSCVLNCGTWRFKYVGNWTDCNTNGWYPEYQVNEEPFTSDQNLAINSGITCDCVTSYTSHLNNTSNPHSVTKSQVGLGNVCNTGDSATPVSGGTTKFTTGGAYTELAKKVNTTRKVNGHALSSDVTVTQTDVGLGNVCNCGLSSTVDTSTNYIMSCGVKNYVDNALSGLGTVTSVTICCNGSCLGSVTTSGSFDICDDKVKQTKLETSADRSLLFASASISCNACCGIFYSDKITANSYTGSIKACCFDGKATDSTCFNGCTYECAKADIISGLAGGTMCCFNVYCGTTCVCSISNGDGLNLNANAFNDYAKQVKRCGFSTAYDFDIALVNGCGDCDTNNLYVSNKCRLLYCNTTGCLRTCCAQFTNVLRTSIVTSIVPASVNSYNNLQLRSYCCDASAMTTNCWIFCGTDGVMYGKVCCAQSIKRTAVTSGEYPILLGGGCTTTETGGVCVACSSACQLKYNVTSGALTTTQGCFTDYVRTPTLMSLSSSGASKINNVVIRSCCTNASSTLTCRNWTFCGSNGYMYGNVCACCVAYGNHFYTGVCFCKADNSGYPTFRILGDITCWWDYYNTSSSITTIEMLGDIYVDRISGYNNCFIGSISAYANYRRVCETPTATNSLSTLALHRNSRMGSAYITPFVVCCGTCKYLALRLTGSGKAYNFNGFISNICSNFFTCEYCYTSSSALPSGWSIVVDGVTTPSTSMCVSNADYSSCACRICRTACTSGTYPIQLAGGCSTVPNGALIVADSTVRQLTYDITNASLATTNIQMGSGCATQSSGVISSKGACSTNMMICFLNNTNDGNGNGYSIGGGGIGIIGAGESANNIWCSINGNSTNLYGACAGNENLYLTSDNAICFRSNVNTFANQKCSYIGTDGYYHGDICGNICGVATIAKGLCFRPSSTEASKVCNLYFCSGCTNSSCAVTNFSACICGANNWFYGLCGIFTPYIRANQPSSTTASAVCNVTINAYCTNSSCACTTRTFTFCGSTGYLHGNVCGNLCGTATKATTVSLGDDICDISRPVVFQSASGNPATLTNNCLSKQACFTYNPSTCIMSVPKIQIGCTMLQYNSSNQTLEFVFA